MGKNKMACEKKLGVLVKNPPSGDAIPDLAPPLTPEGARRLYEAFSRDLFARVAKLKNIRRAVFHPEGRLGSLTDAIPKSYHLTAVAGDSPGQWLTEAFAALLDGPDRCAVIVGSNSPDIPLQYVKRAFLKLKHKDVVLGPDPDGSYYLIGLKKPAPGLFADIDWEKPTVLRETLARVEAQRLTVSLLPLWYVVNDAQSLALLAGLIEARRLERSGRLPATEAVLKEISLSNL